MKNLIFYCKILCIFLLASFANSKMKYFRWRFNRQLPLLFKRDKEIFMLSIWKISQLNFLDQILNWKSCQFIISISSLNFANFKFSLFLFDLCTTSQFYTFSYYFYYFFFGFSFYFFTSPSFFPFYFFYSLNFSYSMVTGPLLIEPTSIKCWNLPVWIFAPSYFCLSFSTNI